MQRRLGPKKFISLKSGRPRIYLGVGAPFFDLNGGTLYAELSGTLYEWDLRRDEPDHEWWIGE